MKGSSYILPKGVIATRDIILTVIILTMNEETKRSKQEGGRSNSYSYLGQRSKIV
jgi:hypothetical protein